MATASTTLSVEQQIIEHEGEVAEFRFFWRWTLLWMTVGNALAITGLVLCNTLIHWQPGNAQNPGDRFWLNLFFGGGTLASIVTSTYWWNSFRAKIRTAEVELRQLHAEKRHLQVQEATSSNTSSAFADYYESIPTLRDEYRQSAERYRGRHNLFQLTVIVGSILTSVSTTAAAEQGIWSWIAVGMSALVSISAGIIAYFKFRERSLNLQQTADAIDLELQTYSLGIRRYRDLPSEDASTIFAEEVERIREEQRKKELQLEQPPESGPQHRPQAV